MEDSIFIVVGVTKVASSSSSPESFRICIFLLFLLGYSSLDGVNSSFGACVCVTFIELVFSWWMDGLLVLQILGEPILSFLSPFDFLPRKFVVQYV